MKRIQNISPEKSRKAALWISIVFMVLFWMGIAAAFLTLVFKEDFAEFPEIVFIALMLPLIVWLIPVQLVRYFRQLRTLQ